MRKVRVQISAGVAESTYSTKQLVERDVTIEVRDDEDMATVIRHLMTDEYKAMAARLEKCPEARPILPPAEEQSQLIG